MRKANTEIFSAAPQVAPPQVATLSTFFLEGRVEQAELLPIPEVDGELLAVAEGREVARFSGVRLERCAELVQRIVELRVAGVPVRAVAQLLRVSPLSIQGVMERAEKSGAIVSVSQRLAAKLARNVEAGLDEWFGALQAGKIHPHSIPLPTLGWIDKLQLLTGQATERTETKRTELTAEDVEAAMARWIKPAVEAVPASAPGSDVSSDDVPQQTVDPHIVANTHPGYDTSPDTFPPPPQPSASHGPHTPGPVATAQSSAAPEAGGGGSQPAPEATKPRGCRSENF